MLSFTCLLEPTMRLRRFADLVVSHVRYEERVIFPQLQSHPSIASVDTLNLLIRRGDDLELP